MKSNNVHSALRKAKGRLNKNIVELDYHTKNDIINIILKHLNGCSYRFK